MIEGIGIDNLFTLPVIGGAITLLLILLGARLMVLANQKKQAAVQQTKLWTRTFTRLSDGVGLPVSGRLAYLDHVFSVWRHHFKHGDRLIAFTLFQSTLSIMQGETDAIRDVTVAIEGQLRSDSYCDLVFARGNKAIKKILHPAPIGLLLKIWDGGTLLAIIAPLYEKCTVEEAKTTTSLVGQIIKNTSYFRSALREKLQTDQTIQDLQERVQTFLKAIGGIRHDLGGTMAPMLSGLMAISEQYPGLRGDIPEILQTNLDGILPTVNGVQQILTNLTEIIEALIFPDQELELEDLLLAITFETMFSTWIKEAGDKNPAVSYTVNIPFDLVVKANTTALYQSLWNILRNAERYTPQGTISISAKMEDDVVYLWITDTGAGMTENDLANIGSFGYRGSLTKEIHGHGIGLWMSYRLVGAMKGKLDVSSQPGRGTTFRLTLKKGEMLGGATDRPRLVNPTTLPGSNNAG